MRSDQTVLKRERGKRILPSTPSKSWLLGVAAPSRGGEQMDPSQHTRTWSSGGQLRKDKEIT